MQRLLDERTRSPAFYELWRRARPAKDKDYAAFLKKHYDPRVVVCPQDGGAPPMYVVLYGFLERYRFEADYDIPNPKELFPPRRTADWPLELDEPGLEAFAADGTRASIPLTAITC